MATAVQMLAGGVLLLGLGTALGELSQISLRSALVLAYLVLFGSLVAFSAYIWLLQVSRPSRVSTYAYVNPLVVLLLADEPMGFRTLGAASVLVSAVMIISVRRRPPQGAPGVAAAPRPAYHDTP